MLYSFMGTDHSLTSDAVLPQPVMIIDQWCLQKTIESIIENVAFTRFHAIHISNMCCCCLKRPMYHKQPDAENK